MHSYEHRPARNYGTPITYTNYILHTYISLPAYIYMFAHICRDKVESMLIPQLTSFAADLLFISAGFDAHEDDFYHFLGN